MSHVVDNSPASDGDGSNHETSEAEPARPRTTPPRRRGLARRAAGRTLRTALFLGLAAALVLAGVGLDRAGVLPGSPNADPATRSPQFRVIDQAWDLIHQQYVDRAHLDDTQLAYAAIAALANAIGDTGHTTFETPADLQAEQAVLSGHYVGIGVMIEPTSGGALVKSVIPAGPAERAELKPGDLIVAVNGRDIGNLTPALLIGLIAGPAGSSVNLTVRPAAGGATREVAIVREPVTLPVVEWAMVPGTHIADIRVDQFSSGATTALVDAVKAAVAAGANRVVLDLRGNPGGLVDEAVGVASQFLASGAVYQTRDASGHQTVAPVKPAGVALKTPLVVLVDHGTASSAEIVAAALQDAGRARIVGLATFGTGTILGQFSLADGSALRIGTLEWLTRNGQSIWHVGLTPDDVVALPAGVPPIGPSDPKALTSAKVASTRDPQLRKALQDVLSPAPGTAPSPAPSATP